MYVCVFKKRNEMVMLSEIAGLTIKQSLPGTLGAEPVMHTEATRYEEKLKGNWFCG